jgi:uncharacterized protein DUF6502
MSYGKFAVLARRAFVEEGLEQLQRAGKRPTISAVSALTGLTRKEAKRLHDMDEEVAVVTDQRYNRGIRVISGWVSDDDFTDDGGRPSLLPMLGPISFTELVKRYSGDIPATAMLSVLEASGTVERDGDQVTLLERAFVPKSNPLDKIDILGRDVAELIGTIWHNIEQPAENSRFQRKVSNVALRRDQLQAFKSFSDQRSQQLLEEYHAWLTAHEAQEADDDSQADLSALPGATVTEGQSGRAGGNSGRC